MQASSLRPSLHAFAIQNPGRLRSEQRHPGNRVGDALAGRSRCCPGDKYGVHLADPAIDPSIRPPPVSLPFPAFDRHVHHRSSRRRSRLRRHRVPRPAAGRRRRGGSDRDFGPQRWGADTPYCPRLRGVYRNRSEAWPPRRLRARRRRPCSLVSAADPDGRGARRPPRSAQESQALASLCSPPPRTSAHRRHDDRRRLWCRRKQRGRRRRNPRQQRRRRRRIIRLRSRHQQ